MIAGQSLRFRFSVTMLGLPVFFWKGLRDHDAMSIAGKPINAAECSTTHPIRTPHGSPSFSNLRQANNTYLVAKHMN